MIQSWPRWVKGTVVLSLTIGLLAYALRTVDIAAVWTLLVDASPLRLTVISSLSLAAYAWLPTWRWQQTLYGMGHQVHFRSLLFARWGSQPLKTAIPFKGGEAFRAIWLQRRHHIPLLDGAASILFDMFLVAVAQLLFLALGLYLAGSELQHGFFPALLILSVGLGLSSPQVQKFAVYVAKRLHQKLGEIAERLAYGFLRFPNGTRLKLVSISLLVELSEILSMWFCFWALDIEVPMAAVLLSMPIVMGFTLMPITLSGFGTREIAILYLFKSYGTPEQLMAAALLFTSVEFVLPTLLGIGVLPTFLSRMSQFEDQPV